MAPRPPFTQPTVDDFIDRFPIFAKADYDQIEFCLDEASGQVDTTWLEQDYRPAILYLTAHLLATDNSQAGEEVQFGPPPGSVVSESFPGMSVTYDKPLADEAATNSQYGSTFYGRRFYALLMRNQGGPIVV
jgi:hypothetical protein